MSAFTVTSVVRVELNGFTKTAIIEVTGPTSYDTNGSILDLSAGAILAAAGALFTRVDAVELVGATPVAATLFDLVYIRAASGAPATGVLVSKGGATQTTGATNLSTNTFRLRVAGA